MKKLLVLFTLIITTMTFSETTYFQVGVTPNLNICKGDEVTGLRVPILFGKTDVVKGVDFTFIAGESNEFYGFKGGIFLGAGIVSMVDYKFRGVGFNMVNLQDGDSKGALIGVGNLTNEFSGFKMGILNYSRGSAGFEFGVFNYSNEPFIQVGLINIASKIDGVQIGLLNFAKDGILPVMPFVNFNWRL